MAHVLDGHLLCHVSFRTPRSHSPHVRAIQRLFPSTLLTLLNFFSFLVFPHLEGWSNQCRSSCFLSADSPKPVDSSSEFLDLSGVPSAYMDVKKVFNKARAMSLSPHRPYDCSIDLLSGTFPPKGCLYSLSAPEREAMNEYIQRLSLQLFISCWCWIFFCG